jgi:hypothetical protein
LDIFFGFSLLFFVYQVAYVQFFHVEDLDVAGWFPEFIRPSLPRIFRRVKIKGASLIQMYLHEMILALVVIFGFSPLEWLNSVSVCQWSEIACFKSLLKL